MSQDRKIIPFKRQWQGAKSPTLLDNWATVSRAPDNDIRTGLRALRARSREAAQNVDHVRGFLGLAESNIVGRLGVVLQSRARMRNGKPDTRVQDTIEASWTAWGKRGLADVTGQYSWRSLQRQVVRTAARDGEALVRIVEGWDSPFGFALQLIDPECLDIQYNQAGEHGRPEIRMGVELNAWRRPVAYYLTDEPSINGGGYLAAGSHERVPAEEIIHCYLPEWIWQSRGVPWIATGLLRLHLLSGYEDAAITAARVAAAKMGFYKQQPDAAPMPSEETDSGEFVQDVSPGTFEQLPAGWDFVGWDPAYPNTDHGDFVKSCLRSIASGLGVNYNTLANDLEGVNYTSLRQGALTERELWMVLQEWFIESFVEPVYARWLSVQLHNGQIELPEPKRIEAARVSWQPRRWPWVDPLKDMQANREAVALRTRSISDIIREQGRDPADVWEELASDIETLDALGLAPADAQALPQQAKQDDDNAEE